MGESKRNSAMERVIPDAEAGRVSAELVRRGIAADARVHALVEVRDASELSTAAIAEASGAFDWLADEPELYSDADLQVESVHSISVVLPCQSSKL
jgi:hypothetical protein